MATESIVKDWIKAYAAHNADKYLLLFGDDAEWMDNADPMFKASGPRKIKDMEALIRSSANLFEFKISSYFISPDSRFAAAQGTLTMQGNTVPTVVIIEFKESKINGETWYYDYSPFN
jgi:ketosteroid isomerase-like protein